MSQLSREAERDQQRGVAVTVAALALITFVSGLSSTVVTNALPVILNALNGSSTQYTWVITVTLLTSTATTPIWGKLSDIVSKKLLLQLSTTIFVLASVFSGLSQSAGELIAFRGVQGIGLGGVQALSLIALAALVPARERGRYGGWFGASSAVAIVSGPLIGGVVVDSIGWRAVFYIGVPFAIVAMVLLQRTLHIPVVRQPVRIDYVGSTLLVAGVSMLLVWVSFAGHQFAWASGDSIGLAAGGVVVLALAVLVESRAADPIVPLSLLRERTPALAIIGSLGAGLALFGSAVFFGQYYQVGRGYSPTQAGLLTIPMMGGLFISSLISGRLITRTGRWKRYLVVGGTLVLIGFSLLGTVGHATPIVLVLCFAAIVGVGVGMTQQNLVLAVQNSVPYNQVGVATSVTTFFRSLGGTIGISALGALLTSRVQVDIARGLRKAGLPSNAAGKGSSLAISKLPARVATVVRASYADSLGLIFLCGAGVAAVSLVAILGIREVPLRTTLQVEELADPAGTAVDPAELT